MQNSVLHAFFLGRALAEVLSERLEESLTCALSELGKFDAEQREYLRKLVEEVQARAAQEFDQGSGTIMTTEGPMTTDALQETLDKLRADIASLKVELKNYRQDPG
ncbi:DUF6825 family protein [Synechocystis sp. LKSZ1]|uniref:DUF6825 family protein n=1 Tax=Synechocystis sp. LKSZ1 TaxID=3144951 RepID=UPI00336BE749